MTDYLSIQYYRKCPRCEAWRPKSAYEKTTNDITRELKTCDRCRNSRVTERARNYAREKAARQEHKFIHARPEGEAARINLMMMWKPTSRSSEIASQGE